MKIELPFIAEIMDELQKVEIIVDPPDTKVTEDETVVDVASDLVKRLYSLRDQLADAANAIPGEERNGRRRDEFFRAKTKHRLIEVLLWTAVDEEHGAWSFNTGIREGWKVVRLPKCPTLQEIMGIGFMIHR